MGTLWRSYIFSAMRGGDAAVPKLISDFLFRIRQRNNFDASLMREGMTVADDGESSAASALVSTLVTCKPLITGCPAAAAPPSAHIHQLRHH